MSGNYSILSMGGLKFARGHCCAIYWQFWCKLAEIMFHIWESAEKNNQQERGKWGKLRVLT